MSAERHEELVGSRIEDVRVDGGLVYLEVSHRGTDDEACTLLVRAVETKWMYPAPAEDGDSRRKETEQSSALSS